MRSLAIATLKPASSILTGNPLNPPPRSNSFYLQDDSSEEEHTSRPTEQQQQQQQQHTGSLFRGLLRSTSALRASRSQQNLNLISGGSGSGTEMNGNPLNASPPSHSGLPFPPSSPTPPPPRRTSSSNGSISDSESSLDGGDWNPVIPTTVHSPVNGLILGVGGAPEMKRQVSHNSLFRDLFLHRHVNRSNSTSIVSPSPHFLPQNQIHGSGSIPNGPGTPLGDPPTSSESISASDGDLSGVSDSPGILTPGEILQVTNASTVISNSHHSFLDLVSHTLNRHKRSASSSNLFKSKGLHSNVNGPLAPVLVSNSTCNSTPTPILVPVLPLGSPQFPHSIESSTSGSISHSPSPSPPPAGIPTSSSINALASVPPSITPNDKVVSSPSSSSMGISRSSSDTSLCEKYGKVDQILGKGANAVVRLAHKMMKEPSGLEARKVERLFAVKVMTTLVMMIVLGVLNLF